MTSSRKPLALLLVFLLLVSTLLMGAAPPDKKMIVVFREGVTQTEKDHIAQANGLAWIENLEIANARVAHISAQKAEKLMKLPEIAALEDDITVSILGKPQKPPVTQPSQVTPWGIGAIDADQVWGSYEGNGIKVGVLDTGIDSSHPDLTGQVAGGANLINPTKSYKDDNNHGTHVAGTIAALNNTIGVVGAGPQIELYALKALNSQGSGFLSDIIEGLAWAVSNDLDVVNMSLGTNSYSLAFENAVNNASAAGVILVAAAGNDSAAVDYPAAFSNVIAVSAVDSDLDVASFSSHGPQVDVAAPGVSVLSTIRGGKYAYYSGTSMATPHVSAVVALMLESGTAVTLQDVLNAFPGDAQDLGATGRDDYYGWGLINAVNATDITP